MRFDDLKTFLAFAFTLDWFQPFTRRSYVSVESFIKFYCLPREECFKRENVILVGVIHNMKTMPKSLNPGRHSGN